MEDSDLVDLSYFDDINYKENGNFSKNLISSQHEDNVILTDQPFVLPKGVATSISKLSAISQKTFRTMHWFSDKFFKTLQFTTSLCIETSKSFLVGSLESMPIGSGDGVWGDYRRRSIATIESGFEFMHWTSYCWLYFSSQITSGTFQAGEESLKFIDSLFGSTESSAIFASFLRLIKNELKPDDNLTPMMIPSIARRIMKLSYLQNAVREHMIESSKPTTLFEICLDPKSNYVEWINAPLSAHSMQALLQSCISQTSTAGVSSISKEDVSSGDEFAEESDSETPLRLHWDVPPSSNYHINHQHLLHNISKYCSFATAAYGRYFMRLLGIANYPAPPETPIDSMGKVHDPSHVIFSAHTGISLENIMQSSFNVTERHKKSTAPFEQDDHSFSHLPEYFISVDHEDKQIVITFRGTFAMVDVLTNLQCHSRPVEIDGVNIGDVHNGMWEQAQAYAKPKNTLHKTTANLLKYHAGYGLVLTGHSLGGGIACLLAFRWANLTDGSKGMFLTSENSGLPANRPIHAYVFGPPCTMSLQLSRAVRGLITTVVHGDDFACGLSLGSFGDLRDIIGKLEDYEKHQSLTGIESNGSDIPAADVITMNSRKRSLEAFDSVVAVNHETISNNAYDFDHRTPDSEEKWKFYQKLSECADNVKLFIPGDVYWVHSENVDLPAGEGSESLDSVEVEWTESRRIKMQYIDDIEYLFGRLRLSTNMFMDHSPGRYEYCLKSLNQGLKS